MASISKLAYLSATPRPAVGKSSNGWQRTSATGVYAPSRFSPCCPHLLRRITAATASRSALWPDRSIIVPIACYRPAGSCPALTAHFNRSLPKESSQRSYNQVRALLLSFGGSSRSRCAGLRSCTATIGKYLMKWVFGFQRAVPVTENGNRWRAFYRPPPVS